MKLETLAARLAARRRELGLLQEHLAEAAGVSKAAVSQWESGETKNLKLAHLFAIADALKVQARWLALGQGPRYVAIFVTLVVPPLLLDAASRLVTCVLCKIDCFASSRVFQIAPSAT